MSAPAIGYAGMTHLGLCSAVGAAARGFEVVGFDVDAARVEALAAGRFPVVEPDLERLAAAHAGKLRFTSRPGDLSRCDVVYVAPDVATDDEGRSDVSQVVSLLELVNEYAAASAVVVVLSQVSPGFTRSRCSGKRALYYQVETLIFGRAIERATQPERFIVGCAEPSRPFPEAYRRFLEAFGCPILPMRYESAELGKIAINACLVSSISVANALAEICERIGADWSEIVPALRLDARIGPKAYLSPGLGIAGGNLERDLSTLRRLAGEHGGDDGVIRSWVANSAYRRDWVLRTLHAEVLGREPRALIAVLGLAYKEDTASVKNSPALALIEELEGFSLRVYDPVVPGHTVASPRLEVASSALGAARGAEAVALMTPWPEFRSLAPAELARAMGGRVVVDPYRLLPSDECREAGLDHFVLGASPARALAR